jgi:hypothetical protein
MSGIFELYFICKLLIVEHFAKFGAKALAIKG